MRRFREPTKHREASLAWSVLAYFTSTGFGRNGFEGNGRKCSRQIDFQVESSKSKASTPKHCISRVVDANSNSSAKSGGMNLFG